jgi:hypothetical protein
VINEWWIGKDLKGSSHVLTLWYYTGICLEELGKPWKPSFKIAGLQAKIHGSKLVPSIISPWQCFCSIYFMFLSSYVSLPTGSFPRRFPTKMLHTFHVSPNLFTFPAYYNLDFTTLEIPRDLHNQQSSLFCNTLFFLQFIHCYFQIILWVLCFQTVCT